jgi:outer membrane murein-binding lipoprotein Lpp
VAADPQKGMTGSQLNLQTRINGQFVMKKTLIAASISLTLLLSACGSGAKDQAASDLAAGGDRLANLPMGLPLMKDATVAHNNNKMAWALPIRSVIFTKPRLKMRHLRWGRGALG